MKAQLVTYVSQGEITALRYLSEFISLQGNNYSYMTVGDLLLWCGHRLIKEINKSLVHINCRLKENKDDDDHDQEILSLITNYHATYFTKPETELVTEPEPEPTPSPVAGVAGVAGNRKRNRKIKGGRVETIRKNYRKNKRDQTKNKRRIKGGTTDKSSETAADKLHKLLYSEGKRVRERQDAKLQSLLAGGARTSRIPTSSLIGESETRTPAKLPSVPPPAEKLKELLYPTTQVDRAAELQSMYASADERMSKFQSDFAKGPVEDVNCAILYQINLNMYAHKFRNFSSQLEEDHYLAYKAEEIVYYENLLHNIRSEIPEFTNDDLLGIIMITNMYIYTYNYEHFKSLGIFGTGEEAGIFKLFYNIFDEYLQQLKINLNLLGEEIKDLELQPSDILTYAQSGDIVTSKLSDNRVIEIEIDELGQGQHKYRDVNKNIGVYNYNPDYDTYTIYLDPNLLYDQIDTSEVTGDELNREVVSRLNRELFELVSSILAYDRSITSYSSDIPRADINYNLIRALNLAVDYQTEGIDKYTLIHELFIKQRTQSMDSGGTPELQPEPESVGQEVNLEQTYIEDKLLELESELEQGGEGGVYTYYQGVYEYSKIKKCLPNGKAQKIIDGLKEGSRVSEFIQNMEESLTPQQQYESDKIDGIECYYVEEDGPYNIYDFTKKVEEKELLLYFNGETMVRRDDTVFMRDAKGPTELDRINRNYDKYKLEGSLLDTMFKMRAKNQQEYNILCEGGPVDANEAAQASWKRWVDDNFPRYPKEQTEAEGEEGAIRRELDAEVAYGAANKQRTPSKSSNSGYGESTPPRTAQGPGYSSTPRTPQQTRSIDILGKVFSPEQLTPKRENLLLEGGNDLTREVALINDDEELQKAVTSPQAIKMIDLRVPLMKIINYFIQARYNPDDAYQSYETDWRAANQTGAAVSVY